MIKRTTYRAALAFAVAAASTQAAANGVAINEQSASSMGTGFAGRSSSAQDASTVFGNPAGMSKLDRVEVSGGFAVIHANTDISNASSIASGSNDGDMVPFAAIPFGYYVRPLNEDWHFGLGVYVPFGVISDYEDRFQGRYHGLKSEVQVVTLQPTLSYRINDRISVGFGPTINHLEGTLTSAVALGASDGNVNIQGDDIGYGFNAGVLVDLSDRVALGVTYHSSVDYTLEGRTRISDAPASLSGKYDATLDVTTPESVDVSLTYAHDARLTLYAGTTWTRWSQFDQLVIENQGGPGPFGTIEEELNWSDTWAFAFGAAYQITPKVVLRTGLAFDRSPTTDADRTVRIPVGNRKVLSLGAGWEATDNLTLDVAYAYLREDKASVSYADYSSDYRNSAHGLATQVTYRY
ncbi:OmpP1/FadL family transporter [Halopseudomonas pelagia]|uniref:OmpP1/FadL family transporter n=1 Tax=Halopseudomonas pelagia TaxID=553151 RepID=UPI00039CE8C1|nr:outer membrane protein transport protein [Halopseudomonas pelagia]|tara:strand:+ start:506 stop:1729 length:1224 start_codon:yes stop_codon:yes gene_type:complete